MEIITEAEFTSSVTNEGGMWCREPQGHCQDPSEQRWPWLLLCQAHRDRESLCAEQASVTWQGTPLGWGDLAGRDSIEKYPSFLSSSLLSSADWTQWKVKEHNTVTQEVSHPEVDLDG